MKRFTLIFASLLLCISLCACGGKKEEETKSDETNIPGYFSSEVISEGGTDKGLWPTDEMPKDVPEFDGYTELDNTSYQKSETEELWDTGFTTDSNGLESYLKSLTDNGYRKSPKVEGRYANGEYYIDIYTEPADDGLTYVSVSVWKPIKVEAPKAVDKNYPKFKTDATIESYRLEDDTYSISYTCATDIDKDAKEYLKTLEKEGFAVTENFASKEIDGKTYTVEISITDYFDQITYTY